MSSALRHSKLLKQQLNCALIYGYVRYSSQILYSNMNDTESSFPNFYGK